MKKILAAKPSITQLEVDYVVDAVSNGWGENCYGYVHQFKDRVQEYFGSPLVWPTSSCHGALHIALMALGVGPGDEVIVPDATWVGSVFPISWLGATPKFVDVLPDTWCISPEEIEKAITPKTKAIIVVHLYGNLCEMDEIMSIGKKYGLPVIEDAAEAIGSEYKGIKAGSLADFGVFSFHGTKTATTGEGGALLSNRHDLSEKVSTIESQGRKPGARLFWVDELGLKYKMSNISAALGLGQFERIEELVENKREIFQKYAQKLKDLPLTMNREQSYTKNGYWMPTVEFNCSVDVEQIISSGNNSGIALRPFFYPVSTFPMFALHPSPISARLHTSAINLPSYYDMTDEDISTVSNFIISELERRGLV